MSQFDESLGGTPGQPTRKDTGTQGREDGQDGEVGSGAGHGPWSHGSRHPAGVVIRATVEHIGLAGDTELTVNVKWPASTFCVPPCKKPSGPSSDSQDVPANGPDALIAEAVADPGPYQELRRLKSQIEKIAKLPHDASPAQVKAAVASLTSGAEHTGPASEHTGPASEDTGPTSAAEPSKPYSGPTPKAETKTVEKSK